VIVNGLDGGASVLFQTHEAETRVGLQLTADRLGALGALVGGNRLTEVDLELRILMTMKIGPDDVHGPRA